MTNKEARDILITTQIDIRSPREDDIISLYFAAQDIAIIALEKQIPKSIVLEGDDCADGVMIYDTWICPRCGKHYELEYDDYDYCPNCGQALDWEEDDE